jgi:hypothetical protein
LFSLFAVYLGCFSGVIYIGWELRKASRPHVYDEMNQQTSLKVCSYFTGVL